MNLNANYQKVYILKIILSEHLIALLGQKLEKI